MQIIVNTAAAVNRSRKLEHVMFLLISRKSCPTLYLLQEFRAEHIA